NVIFVFPEAVNHTQKSLCVDLLRVALEHKGVYLILYLYQLAKCQDDVLFSTRLEENVTEDISSFLFYLHKIKFDRVPISCPLCFHVPSLQQQRVTRYTS